MQAVRYRNFEPFLHGGRGLGERNVENTPSFPKITPSPFPTGGEGTRGFLLGKLFLKRYPGRDVREEGDLAGIRR
jgi:hypothetical protein